MQNKPMVGNIYKIIDEPDDDLDFIITIIKENGYQWNRISKKYSSFNITGTDKWADFKNFNKDFILISTLAEREFNNDLKELLK